MKVFELIELLRQLPPDDEVKIKVRQPEAVMASQKWSTVDLAKPYRQNDAIATQTVLVPQISLQRSYQ